MKKLAMITITMAILTMLNMTRSSAANNDKGNSLHNVIQRSLAFPANTEGIMQDAVVYVSFTIDESNKITIQELNASNNLFRDYIAKKLMSLDLQNVLTEPGKLYVYKMSFINRD
jgi:flagellar basal body-associated protein FliL